MDMIQASLNELNETAALFDAYRQFYDQAADLSAATTFIEQRLTQRDSVIFLARDTAGEAVAFVQLYPSFSSVAMKRTWILNDLFVKPSSRQQGVAKALLLHAEQFAKASSAQSIRLATAVSNQPAKALYEALGYAKMSAFDHYSKSLG
ncbi:putative acetyltransferase [Marinomonas aquimarina]|uniref:Putative acetyltransferase n=1 Tax=Marinomonas aquimarina TaxID=295068 RepID=A0A1A8T8S5_9GAMM|nr:GNAT family N-acetyltransferase [Marinomonas aquimarina]SBS29087.1 putative acetyltransferase [Marinomonas aquimarina]